MDAPDMPAAGQPFSMHARGVATYDTQQYCDISYQFRKFVQELRDISSSLLMLLYLQSWQAMFVVVITISSVSFFTYVGKTGAEASLNWTLVCFVVLLPQTLLLYLVFWRREAAYRELAIVRTLSLQLLWSFEDLPNSTMVQELLASLLGCLESYLNGARFYSFTYPFTDVTQRMTMIAQVKAKQARQQLLIFANLARCPERTSIVGIQQMKWLAQLQTACEQLSIIKEYRTPQSLRTLIRFYIILIIPIFYGPYYAQISNSTRSFVYVLAFACMMHLGMAILMNATIALEDPFATEGVDGIFVEELLYEVQQVLKRDVVLLNGDHERTRNVQQAVPPPINSMTEHGRPDQHAVEIVSQQPLPNGDSPRGE